VLLLLNTQEGKKCYYSKIKRVSSQHQDEESKTIQIASVTVPNLIGKSIQEAEETRKKIGLNYEKAFITTVQAQFKGKEGKIVKQSPNAGKKVTTGRKIWIYIYNPKTQTLIQIQPTRPDKIDIKDIDLTPFLFGDLIPPILNCHCEEQSNEAISSLFSNASMRPFLLLKFKNGFFKFIPIICDWSFSKISAYANRFYEFI